MKAPPMTGIKESLVARIDRWLTVIGEPMGNGRANPDNDMIYLLRDCRAALAQLESADARERVAQAVTAELERMYKDGAPMCMREGETTWRTYYAGFDLSMFANRIVDAILATGLVTDEAAIRADEREKCAKVADGWLAQFAHHEIKYVSARMYASDAIQDIATAIRKMPQEVKHEAE